ncbi:DinB family protein [Paenibacillus glycanilyticus]|uniref:DinB family protein n=1 Tax=Paenibacillus glycanilyticus TaxID=126569 RepID=UPI00203D7C4A|nr:DinB family protein [Paenibacillus glycanilyticus]MCM3626912.1 DinB family protein [Paenibacillus glycanilyticus]
MNINEFIAGWKSHRNVLNDMLEEATTEQLSFKPWEKGMTVAELALHITGSMDMFMKTDWRASRSFRSSLAAVKTVKV